VRAVGIKPLENSLQGIVADARPVVIDHDLDFRSLAAADDANLAAGFGKRLCIGEQIGDHLSEP